jgi:hypothetical protein
MEGAREYWSLSLSLARRGSLYSPAFCEGRLQEVDSFHAPEIDTELFPSDIFA